MEANKVTLKLYPLKQIVGTTIIENATAQDFIWKLANGTEQSAAVLTLLNKEGEKITVTFDYESNTIFWK